MSSLRDVVHRLAHALEAPWDRIRRRLAGPPRRITVVTYVAHGSNEVAVIRGRALADRPIAVATGPEPLRDRFRRMAHRFVTREIPDLPLTVSLADASAEVVTDEEGYFLVELRDLSLPPGPRFRDLTVTVNGPLAALPTHHGSPRILVPAEGTTRLLISDIDDTVLRTGATNRIRMTVTTLTGSVWTRASFAGVAELYEGLVHSTTGDDHPCFYVSSSPWNLYDFLVVFLDRNRFPAGPLFLRDYGVDEHQFLAGGHEQHKSVAISEILRVHTAPVVLSGDTGELDPEIFRDVVRQHGDRVEGVLLRHVGDAARLTEVRAMFDDLPAPVCVEQDSVGLSVAAEEAGLIPAGWADRVRRAR